VIEFPQCDGPHDVPTIRDWLLKQYQYGGPLYGWIDSDPIRNLLPTVQLWWVEPETCDLLATMAPTLPDDYCLDVHDVPTPAGFAIFAHNMEGIDAARPDSTTHVSALLWGPSRIPPYQGKDRVGISVCMFTRARLQSGLTPTELERHAMTMAVMAQGEDGTMTGDIFSYMGRTDWINGAEAVDPILDNTTGIEDFTLASMVEDRKLLATLWEITKTPAVRVERTKPPRHVARRSERKGRSADVRVLTLHRHEPAARSEPSGLGRDWQHSWIVAPHWRWQAHGPGRKLRKLTKIDAYRKGPEDKPLLGAERVWRVVPPKPREK
jgi:hypothetical protein